MQLITLLPLALATLGLSASIEERQSNGNIALTINGGAFNLNYLQTFRLSYANTSAYLGGIKYQSYSEPLIVNPPPAFPSTSSLTFFSIHSSPTGFQNMYVVPHQSQPIGFSVPHGSAPSGVRTTGFSFAADGGMRNNGYNLFYACQDAELDSLHAWQVYWMAGPAPPGMRCKGPIKIQAGDACARF
jgi:hypothetical protein